MAETNSGSFLESTKNSEVYASAAFESVTNGPVAQGVKDHTSKAGDEFSSLAASRKTPANPAATGQPLTHYHSFFFELLSWKNPRASAIAYTSTVTLILAFRYFNFLRLALRLSWMALAISVAAEAAGRFLLDNGLASQMRPRRYYTVSRETLDRMIGDVHELINFFVIEAQRIFFAENIWASLAACVSAFFTYYLVKIMPYWGLAILGTTVAFMVPLVYTSNQELIDAHLKNASDTINAQTSQVRSVAQKQVGDLSAMGKQYAGEYTGKVQEMLRGSKPMAEPATTEPTTAEPTPAAKAPEFPTAPTEEPVTTDAEPGVATIEKEPMIAS